MQLSRSTHLFHTDWSCKLHFRHSKRHLWPKHSGWIWRICPGMDKIYHCDIPISRINTFIPLKRRFHSSITFRNGPISGTVWVCGGEIYQFNKKLKAFAWTFTRLGCFSVISRSWNCFQINAANSLFDWSINSDPLFGWFGAQSSQPLF